jgi:glycine/D-amino acid oxidase-like deaminating enzyme
LPPIESACYWLASRTARADGPAERLAGDAKADVLVVGGGFTGLWSALFLKELDPALDVAIVEQGRIAYGGSGRNGGIVGETLDHSHELAAAHFGREEARELARLGRENLDELERWLAERGIDAELERRGQLIVALSPAHEEQLRRAVDFARGLGLDDWRYLAGEEVRGEIASPLYRGAAHAPRSGTVHPVKLAEGLAAEARRLGVRIYERTAAAELAIGPSGVAARTGGGTVRAEKATLATNAWSHHLRRQLARRFLPLYDYILVSEPLTAGQKASIGWRDRQAVTDARAFFNYYRQTADGRILFGTSEAVYYPANRVDSSCDHSPAHYRALEESFRRHFPALSGLRFPYAWGGPICSTTRLTPFFGSVGGRLFYGLGYTGHGIGSTRIAGRILAHRVLGRPSPLLDLRMVRRKPFPYPPEPLRRLAVAAVTRRLRAVDAGQRPAWLLRILEKAGVGFSS